MTRTFAITLSLLAVACVAAAAQAQDAPRRPLSEALRVEPQGAPCLTREELTARVARWLGDDQIDAAIGIDVWASSEPGGVQGSFILRRDGAPSAERSFEVLPRDCRARLAAMSLAIALAIDHTVLERIPSEDLAQLSGERATGDDVATGDGEDSRRTDDASGAAAPENEDEVDTREEEEDVSSGGRRTYGPGAGPDVSLAVGGFVSAEVVPDIAPGARAELGLAFGPTWSLRLSGLFVSEVQGDLGRGSVAAALIAGAAHACAGTPLDRLRVSGCAGLGVGAYSARGLGFESMRETTREWMGVGVAAEVAFRLLGDLALRLRPELLVPLVRPSLEVVDPAGVPLADLTAPAVGALVGLEVLYPMP